jgi:two-component system OmpR family sensor kinase/two-component system sensor histidine kinase BaeS
MAEALQRSDRERRNLLADVTHELRTPLTVLRGRLEGIVDGVYPADEAHIAPALEETYLLERLVEDLRLLTLAETRQLRFEPRLCDLGEIVQRVAQLFEAEAGEKGIHLETRIASPLPEARVDPQRVEQVVGNLISNALRYAPENSPVAVEVVSDGERVSVSVRDRGPGVPEADLPNIFDRFWRGEKSRSRATGGAGLGLAIARNLVEAQHGRVFAHNQPEGGLVVGFSFERG